MAIDTWWYEKRRQWCVDAPAKNGRKRLYLGADKAKAQAELHRHMAAYYEQLGAETIDSTPRVRTPASAISLLEA